MMTTEDDMVLNVPERNPEIIQQQSQLQSVQQTAFVDVVQGEE